MWLYMYCWFTSVNCIPLVVVILYCVVQCTLLIYPVYFEYSFHSLLFLSAVFIFYTTLYRHVIYCCIIDISGKRNARDNGLHRDIPSSAFGELLLSYLSK